MSPETETMSPFPAATDEIAWLQALHALELCQQVAELAARCGESRQFGESHQQMRLTRFPANPITGRTPASG
jgi:hypothetical protein